MIELIGELSLAIAFLGFAVLVISLHLTRHDARWRRGASMPLEDLPLAGSLTHSPVADPQPTETRSIETREDA